MRDLIETIEAIEARAWADLVEAAPPAVRRAAGLAVEAIGDARVISATALDSVLFNRAIGVRADALGAIRSAVAHFRARDQRRFFVHLGPEARAPELQAALAELGLARYRRAWDKFVRDARTPPAAVATDLIVRDATAADADACGAVLARELDTGAATAAIYAAAVGRAGWRVVVACLPEDPAGAPVAAGGLFVDGDVGYLAFAATSAAHRRRGAQGAIMARRIRMAAALGCRWVTTETGEPVSGEPGPSHANMLRHGFTIAQRRDNYAPIGFTWDAVRGR